MMAMIGVSGVFLILVYVVLFVGIPVLVVSLMIRLFRFLKSSAKEQQLLRMELGKLAEEVKLMRAQKERIK